MTVSSATLTLIDIQHLVWHFHIKGSYNGSKALSLSMSSAEFKSMSLVENVCMYESVSCCGGDVGGLDDSQAVRCILYSPPRICSTWSRLSISRNTPVCGNSREHQRETDYSGSFRAHVLWLFSFITFAGAFEFERLGICNEGIHYTPQQAKTCEGSDKHLNLCSEHSLCSISLALL